MPSLHTHALRVYYEDTDFSGVVYHASYLRFLERGRTELLREIGIHQQALHQQALHQQALHAEAAPLAFAVRRMTLDFRRPARMDDWLVVETRVTDVGGARAGLAQTIRRGDEVLLEALVEVVAVAGGRAARLPPELRARFEAMRSG